MSGYIRFLTDVEGRLLYVEDSWFVDYDSEQYLLDIGYSELEEMIFQPNALLLISFNIEVETNYSYYDGVEYDICLKVGEPIILKEDYEPKKHYSNMELEEESSKFLAEWVPF